MTLQNQIVYFLITFLNAVSWQFYWPFIGGFAWIFDDWPMRQLDRNRWAVISNWVTLQECSNWATKTISAFVTSNNNDKTFTKPTAAECRKFPRNLPTNRIIIKLQIYANSNNILGWKLKTNLRNILWCAQPLTSHKLYIIFVGWR